MADETDDLSVAPQPPLQRPETTRSSTDPSPAALSRGWFKARELQDRPTSSGNTGGRNAHHRNRSPYSRSHLRSRSTGTSGLAAPPMMRAHSMPNPHMPRPFDTAPSTAATTPSSGSLSPAPLRSPARVRSPFKTDEGGYNVPLRSSSSSTWLDVSSSGGVSLGIEAIQEEDSEFEIQPQPAPSTSPPTSSLASVMRSNSLRSGRRPSSPLHYVSSSQSVSAPSLPASATAATDAYYQHHPHAPQHHQQQLQHANSPFNAQKYNEAYPTSWSQLHHYASTSSFSSSFSIPSTPTSARSRSPSISSLETIEDAPEEESEAETAAVIERLKLAADNESDGEAEGGSRRRSLEVGARTGRRGGVGSASERKRWSVCGAERRADLDLETIWED